MHDFAVTPNYTLFLDFPLRFQLQELIDSQGQVKPFAFDPVSLRPAVPSTTPSLSAWHDVRRNLGSLQEQTSLLH